MSNTFKRVSVLILLALLTSSASAQFRTNIPPTRIKDSVARNQNSSLSSLLNSDRLSMHHSFSLGMASMEGTAGSILEGFIIMWLFMMTAMMLPSAAPFISLYSGMVSSNRLPRLFLFGAGYMLIWGFSGFPAFGLALGVDEIVQEKSSFGTVLACVVFVFCICCAFGGVSPPP